MKVISFINNKGGVLKTTLAVNLAGVLAKKGKKVLILDTDPQSSVLSRFGRNGDDEKHNLNDLFKKKSNIAEAIKYVYEDKIAIIGADFPLSVLEAEIQSKIISSQEVNKIFINIKEKAKKEFNYLFIDTAPTFGRLTNEVLKITDEVISPVAMEPDSFKGLVNLINVLKTSNNKEKLKWVIPTLFKARTLLHQNLLEQWVTPLAKKEKFQVSQNIVKSSIQDASISALSKMPITLSNSKVQSKMIYFKIAKEIGIV